MFSCDECGDILGFSEFLVGVETPIIQYYFIDCYFRLLINLLISEVFPIYIYIYGMYLNQRQALVDKLLGSLIIDGCEKTFNYMENRKDIVLC